MRWNIKRETSTVPNREEAAGVREKRKTVNEKMRATSCPIALCDKNIMEIEMLHAGWKQQRMLQQFSNESHNSLRLINDAWTQLSHLSTKPVCVWPRRASSQQVSSGYRHKDHRGLRPWSMSHSQIFLLPFSATVSNHAFEVLRR